MSFQCSEKEMSQAHVASFCFGSRIHFFGSFIYSKFIMNSVYFVAASHAFNAIYLELWF